jgi:hypothetical protein
MTGITSDADEVLLLRHIPGGTLYQGKPPLRITSENFKLRVNPGTGETETGISVRISTVGTLLTDANALLTRHGAKPDSRIGWAYRHAVEAAGFSVQHDPTPDDLTHYLIQSGTSRLEDHAGRKRLAAVFNWVDALGSEPRGPASR